MALTYQKLREEPTKRGIDVRVAFYDSISVSAVIQCGTFHFDDKDQIKSELASRMANAISNIEYAIANPIKTEFDMLYDVREYCKNNLKIERKDVINLANGVSLDA